jgi:hypothetical protein
VDRRDAAPARGPFTAPVLKIKIYGWQRDHRDTRLGAEIDGSAHLLFGLDRKAATMATNAPATCASLVAAGSPLSSTCRSTSRPRSEARRSMVSRSGSISSIGRHERHRQRASHRRECHLRRRRDRRVPHRKACGTRRSVLTRRPGGRSGQPLGSRLAEHRPAPIESRPS